MNNNIFQVLGISHKFGAVGDREKAISFFKTFDGFLLITCNRVESYFHGQLGPINDKNYYHYTGEKAVSHLFRVSSGLDSQVLGESEILRQIKDVYINSIGKDPVLEAVFKKAIEVGKLVRSETGISKGNLSIAGLAVSKAIDLLPNADNKKIILIGTGKVSRSILKILIKSGFTLVFVANRTFDKAKELAENYGGTAIHFDKLMDNIEDADLIISSTSAPHVILKKEHIVLRKKQLIVIDLAVPRDVDPKISEISGVTLLNIDSINEEFSVNLAKREIEAVFAEKIVSSEVEKFCAGSVLEAAQAY